MKKIISAILLAALLSLLLASCQNSEESYATLDAHICANAEEKDGVTELILGQSAKDGVSYTRLALRTDSEIELMLRVSEGEELLRSFSLYINKSDFTSYKWIYAPTALPGQMNGVIFPDEYIKEAQTLGYRSAGVSDDYEAQSRAAQAKDMCDILLASLASDLASLELSAASFGFKAYKD